MGAVETDSEGSTEYLENPITINSFDGETVTFTVSQKWTTDCTVDWITTTYPVSDDQSRCDTENSVVPDGSSTYTAACVDNWAIVTVLVHDESFATDDNPAVPSFCANVGSDEGNKASYTFRLPCDCSTPPTTMQDASPSPAPTSECDYFGILHIFYECQLGLGWCRHWFRILFSLFDMAVI